MKCTCLLLLVLYCDFCAIWVMGLPLDPTETTLESSWKHTTLAHNCTPGQHVLEVSPRRVRPEMLPGVNNSQAIEALYLKWNQCHKRSKATSHYTTLISTLIG